MARGRRWTQAEDSAIEHAAVENWQHGIFDLRARNHPGRLRILADQLGRSYAAVLKRAHRLGAASYRPREAEDDR